MLAEIPISQLASYRSRFTGPHLALVLDSIAAGNTAARLWAAPEAAVRGATLLWDQGNNVFYLGGELSGTAREDLAGLIADLIRQLARAAGAPYFKARALAPEIEAALPQLFARVALRELPTLFYRLATARPAPPTPAVAGLRLEEIDQELLADDQLAGIAEVRAEIAWMWPAIERFYTHGLGVAAIAERRVICWCTAEYVSASRCGIGIATDPQYQRRGVATATAARFVELCQRRGMAPFWECRADNPSSIRVAEKAGFELIAQERYWAGAFEDRDETAD
jgi:RimJ/RimL family protein N-acetyltransferase